MLPILGQHHHKVQTYLFVTMVCYSWSTASGLYCFIITIAVSGNLLQPLSAEPPRARVSSGYIRQMNEEKLLIPGKIIHLQDCIGQGERLLLVNVDVLQCVV